MKSGLKYAAFLTVAIVAMLQGASLAQSCENMLGNNLYLCDIKTDFATEFTDCFQFTSPGVVSLDFDLYIYGLGETLACDCKASGKFKAPVFSSTPFFHCVNENIGDINSLNVSFEGKAADGGDVIKKGQAVNEYGDSFVFICILDPTCGVIAQAAGAPSPWLSDRAAAQRKISPADR